MGKIIAVTSFKGGVGKSTVAVNMSMKLSMSGYKVMICDIDSSAGSVALMLGRDGETMHNFCDHIKAVSQNKDIQPDKAGENLYYLCAPFSVDNYSIDEEMFVKFLNSLRAQYDYIIFDCPPGRFNFFDIITKNADFVYVVTMHIKTSVKATERMKYFLSENDVKNARLIINCFDPEGIIKGTHPGIVEMIESFKLKLAGIIEFDPDINIAAEKGLTVYGTKNKIARKYFDDITSRLLGKNITLNKKYRGRRVNRLYYKKTKQG